MIYIIIIFIILLLAITIRKYNHKEHLTTLSNEAIQDLASMYNGETLNVQNLCINKGETINCLTSDTIHKLNLLSQSGGIRNYNMFNPNECLIYQNIYDAKNANVIAKLGNPAGYNDTSWSGTNLWYGFNLISYGKSDPDGNGMQVTVPLPPSGGSFAKYSVVWLRFLNDRWTTIKVYYDDNEIIGFFGTGKRSLNSYSPDGALFDGTQTNNGEYSACVWFPIPIPLINTGQKKNIINIISKDGTGQTYGENNVSGIAFSTNPWNLAMNSAFAYFYGFNDIPGSMLYNMPIQLASQMQTGPTLTLASMGSNGINNAGQDSNGSHNADEWGTIIPGFTGGSIFNVPIVYNGKDKLLYIIGGNEPFDDFSVITVKVNNTPIERFRTIYNNPFAIHFNSKPNQRFIAALIPASVLTYVNAKVIQVNITTSPFARLIHFREIGTIDA